MALSTTTSPSSSQTSTQSPQAASGSGFGASQSEAGVQSGTAESLLNSSNGIKLSNTNLTNIDLNTASSSTSSSGVKASNNTYQHHVNVGFLIFAILLVMVAGILFWTAGRSVKNTT